MKSHRIGSIAVATAVGLCLVIEGARAQESEGMPAVTPPAEANLVLPFTDVSPDHWAYQALLNLAGTYGCLRGYPDGTFRGEASVSRDEFAAGMDACLGAAMGLVEAQSAAQQQAIDDLIESMAQSLEELRQLEQEVTP